MKSDRPRDFPALKRTTGKETTGTDTMGNRAGVSRAGEAGAGEAGVPRAGVTGQQLAVMERAVQFIRSELAMARSQRDAHIQMLASKRPLVDKEYHRRVAAAYQRQIEAQLWLLDRKETRGTHASVLHEVALTPAQRKRLLD